ncbi:MAG: ribosome-binding factor A [Candidatus Pacebacteria bacterium]|nr:ribosome-binding factor A [Candidatus Paceibacterota bacterium]
MSENRTEKIIRVIKEAAASFMQLESNGASLVTITEVRLSKDEKYANIYFTVLPEDKEEAVLEFAKRKRSEFRQYAKSKTRLGRIPMFDFDIDLGEKHRQKIDIISLKS